MEEKSEEIDNVMTCIILNSEGKMPKGNKISENRFHQKILKG